MKKRFWLLLALAGSILCALFGLTACGGTGNNSDDEEQTHVHSGEWTIVKEATCTEDGKRERVCTECGELQTEAIPKKDHDFNSNNVCRTCGFELEVTVGLNYEEYEEEKYPRDKVYAVTGMGMATDKDLVIPAYYMGKKVKKISASAFKGKDFIKSVYIANGIEEIGAEAFNYCSSIEKVTVPNSTETIGKNAFADCTKLSTIVLPDKGLSIGSGVFSGTAYYKNNKNWEKGILMIGNHLIATNDSFRVSSYTVTDSVKSIAASAFSGQKGLTELTIKSGNTIIGSNAFGNTGITKATVHSSALSLLPAGQITELTITGGYSVNSLSSFKNVKKLVANCDLGYGDTPSLKGLSQLEELTVYSLAQHTSNTYKNYHTLGQLFGDESFSGAVAVEQPKLTLKESSSSKYIKNITTNGRKTYYFPQSLKKVTVLAETVPCYAFSNCTMLTEVNFGKKVEKIMYHVVQGCENLRFWNYEGTLEEFLNVEKSNYISYIGNVDYWEDAEDDEIEKSIVVKVDGKELKGKVTLPDGTAKIGKTALSGCKHITEVVIPNSVTEIGNGAFFGCSSLTSIVIPDGVTSIGGGAFTYCSSLTSIIVDSNNVSYASQGGILYNKAKTEIIHVPLAIAGAVTISDGVTSIEEYAFRSCSSMTSVVIPDSVTSIGENAFIWCSSLTSVTIPDSVTSIGSGAFYYCSSLASVMIPDSVTSIGGSTFRGCSSLTSIVIPDSVTSIGGGTFYDCSSLTGIVIPDGVTSIEQEAFYKCSSLASIVIPDSVTSIGYRAFENCSSLTSITYLGDIKGWCEISGLNNLIPYGANDRKLIIDGQEITGELVIPDGATSIGEYAFYKCSSLTSVIIPDSVTSIGEKAFYNCSSLTSVTIGNGVTSIGKDAFYNCSSLTSVVIPDGVTSIGDSTFRGCSKLTSVTIPDSVTSIGWSAFNDCSELTSVTIGDSVTSIGNYAFDDCSKLTSVVIPDSVTTIGNGAFEGCSSLTSVTIPDGVTSIGERAFNGCSSLTSVTIPDGVTSIGEEAFYGCSSLTSVVIGNSVTSIGDFAFNDCSSLTSVTISDSVTSIGIAAFQSCRALTDITYHGTKAKWKAIRKSDYWNNITGNYTVHCTDGDIKKGE